MTYDLIVFDWDGTIMDSEARIVTCMQAASRDLEYPVPDYHATKDIIGLGLSEAVRKLFTDLDEGQIDAMGLQYRKHFLANEIPNSVLFDGAESLIKTLVEQEYFLAVATGKSRRGLEKEFTSSGLGTLFHTSRCADEAYSKPHPQMLLDILDHLGIEASKTLVVGDTEYDMQMAINAGADALGVSYGVHEPQRLRDHGALDCLDKLAEMPNWLQNQKQGAT